MTTPPIAGLPWYRYFWPWFIVILLGISVVASLATVAIAYRARDIDVRIEQPIDPSGAPVPDARSVDG